MDSSGVFGPCLLCIVGQPYGERSLHRKTCDTDLLLAVLSSVFQLAASIIWSTRAFKVHCTEPASQRALQYHLCVSRKPQPVNGAVFSS